MIAITVSVFLFLLWRGVLPLNCKWYWRVAAGFGVLLISLKFLIVKLVGGSNFAPNLPAWTLLLFAQIHITAFFFIFYTALTDTFLFGLAAGKTFYILLHEKRFDWKTLLKKHPQINKIHAVGLAGAFLLSFWGISNGLATPRIRHEEIISDRVPKQADGVTISVLADLHIDNLNNAKRIRKIVNIANALDPDIVCLLGDFADGVQKQHLDALSELKNLRSRHGVFGVTGNHEYYCGYQQLMAHFRKIGLPILDNENVLLKELNIRVCGITDRQAKKHKELPPDIPLALAGGTPEEYRILLAHRPHEARFAASCGADLQLSGHTHGGLVRGFDRIIAKSCKGFAWGTHRIGKMFLVISNGTCMWSGFPLRFGRPAEIILLTLRKKK